MSTRPAYIRPRTLVSVVVPSLVALALMTAYAASKNAMSWAEAVWLTAFTIVAGGTYLVLECRNSLVTKHAEHQS